MDTIQRKTYEIGLSLGPGGNDDEARATTEAFAWYAEHIRRLVADKRAHPGEGLIDAFIAAQDEGRMTEEEVVYTILLFFAVGHLDVKHLINHGIWLMTQQPGLFAAYRDEPEARPGIINEILRIDTPESMVVRLTTQDTVIGDTTVPAGEALALLIASANRDPEVFADPDTFDHTRPVAAEPAPGLRLRHARLRRPGPGPRRGRHRLQLDRQPVLRCRAGRRTRLRPHRVPAHDHPPPRPFPLIPRPLREPREQEPS